MRRRHRLAVVIVSVSVLAAWTAPSMGAIEDNSVRIAVALAATSTCADVAPAALRRLPLANALVQQADLEGYDPARHELVLSRPATLRLVTNASALEQEQEDAPKGPLPDANGRAFVVMVGGERSVGGLIVARLDDLRAHGGCAVLIVGPVVGGRLHLLLGQPRSREELHEDFWKVFMEEGAESALAPALPTKVSALLSALFPAK